MMAPEALKAVRLSLGLSQREFARLIGARSLEHVCRMENGKNTITAATEIIVHLIQNPFARAEVEKIVDAKEERDKAKQWKYERAR